MQSTYKYVPLTQLVLLLAMLMSPSIRAHLMVAQHGTLNFIDDSVFMVLSLPMSAFEGIDDNNDGEVSMIEFNNHRAAIVESVEQKVTLSDKEGQLFLEGIMLSPVVPHDSPNESISHLTVMGRFALADAMGALRFQVGLFGKQPTGQRLKMTATRQSNKQKHVFELTPATSTAMLSILSV